MVTFKVIARHIYTHAIDVHLIVNPQDMQLHSARPDIMSFLKSGGRPALFGLCICLLALQLLNREKSFVSRLLKVGFSILFVVTIGGGWRDLKDFFGQFISISSHISKCKTDLFINLNNEMEFESFDHQVARGNVSIVFKKSDARHPSFHLKRIKDGGCPSKDLYRIYRTSHPITLAVSSNSCR